MHCLFEALLCHPIHLLPPFLSPAKLGDLIIITVPPTVSPNQVSGGDTVTLKFAATLSELEVQRFYQGCRLGMLLQCRDFLLGV